MKMIIAVALAVVAVAAALPVEEKPLVGLRKYFNEARGRGYAFEFESDDNIKRDEVGEEKEVLDEDNKPHVVLFVRGSYTYINPDGTEETVTYYADENGYHAEGPSIPKSA